MQTFDVEAPKDFGRPVSQFSFTVPSGYCHNRQVDGFRREVEGFPSTYSYDEDLSDANFAGASFCLKPGKSYLVKILPTQRRIYCPEVVKSLRRQGAVLVGAQGLTLIQSLRSDQFPWGNDRPAIIVSLDKKAALWKDDSGVCRVPQATLFPDGEWAFGLFDWTEPLCWDCYCLAVYPLF